jgi:hypothetical protein
MGNQFFQKKGVPRLPPVMIKIITKLATLVKEVMGNLF